MGTPSHSVHSAVLSSSCPTSFQWVSSSSGFLRTEILFVDIWPCKSLLIFSKLKKKIKPTKQPTTTKQHTVENKEGVGSRVTTYFMMTLLLMTKVVLGRWLRGRRAWDTVPQCGSSAPTCKPGVKLCSSQSRTSWLESLTKRVSSRFNEVPYLKE